MQHALYYPHISLRDTRLIKSMALFHDRIYRIVPDGVELHDDPELMPLIEQGSIGSIIDPRGYAEDAADLFLQGIDEWDAAALTHQDEECDALVEIHIDKTDQRVRRLFAEAGYDNGSEWFHVPTELASNYMLFLAGVIAKKNGLSLSTSDWGAHTGANYFLFDGRIDDSISQETHPDRIFNPFSLFGLVMNEMIPINISEIPSSDILNFRLRRHDEIVQFRAAIQDLAESIENLDCEETKLDAIKDKVDELDRAKAQYMASADLIKAKGWFGFQMMGIPASAIALGSILGFPGASTVALGTAGLAMGVLYSLSLSKEELRELNAKNPASFIVEANRSFKNYSPARGAGDLNARAWSCMEEYVND